MKLFLDFHPKFSISNNMCTDIWYFGPVWSTWTSHGIHGRHYDSDQHYLKEKYISKQTTHALPQNCRVRYYPKSAKYRIFKGNFKTFYAMIFLSRGNCNLQKYSYHPYFWGKSQNILSSIIWMIVSYDDVFTTIIGTSVIFMNSLLLIGYVYFDFTKNKS